jgi:hypothetical protein
MCQQGPFDVRRDEPFADDAAVAAMVVEFEACRWPFVRWTHRCHLAAAAWYLQTFPYDEALVKVRDGIQRYNRACGTGDGYSETITQLYLKLLRSRLDRAAGEPLVSIVDELARTHPMAWVRQLYSSELLASRAAIDGWAAPDRGPLPAELEDR